ncbi:MAG: type I methionyl aminopeptidase [Candidatus Peregrinibacteria bacterium]|nr:type I methionyl aminopeptidase [Candidatus Peregrinibacteria bacterium]MCB9807721.1 type I methionyl aminopeptidase [Candidatus Peribacteria bacterium]
MTSIKTFNAKEIESFRHAGKILGKCLDKMGKLVAAGITTKELDRAAEEFIRSHEGAEPAFMGYHGYPATLCTSVNDQCVHGMPGDLVLRDGDIISVDCGVLYNGLYTDACRTFPVGKISKQAQRLLNVTSQALEDAVAMIKGGITVGDISSTVQATVEGAGLTVVSALTGHGLGKTLHMYPDIPNFGDAGKGAVIPAHTVIAVEPIVCTGGDGIQESDDNWTILTKDGSLSAHFEHTILVLEEGCEVLDRVR